MLRPTTTDDGPGTDGSAPDSNATTVPARPRRGRPAPDALLLAVAIAAVTALVKVAWPRFTWFGDNTESFYPMWHMVGSALREGRWLGFDPTGFAGANVVGESGYGLFNPVTLANAVFISGFDELARASFLVTAEFLILLGLAVRRLALAYGACRATAFAVGVIVPFSGFTLYWDAGNWIGGLMSITWVVWTWGAARRFATGAGGPAALVAFGALAVTVGYPYALLGVVVVLAGTTVELGSARRYGRLGGLVVAGLCIGAVALLTYLPLMAALPMGYRDGAPTVSNVSYLAPSIGDLLGLSSPTLLPEINAWGGRSDVVPSVYLSWVMLPLLPWLRWRSSGDWRARLGLLVPTGFFLLCTLGPDRLWMFRWPLRLVEYSWVGLVVCFAILLSAGLTTDRLPRRAGISAAIVTAGFFFAWSSTPDAALAHLGWTAAVGALVAGTIIAVLRRGMRAFPAMVLVGTMVVTPAQAAVHGWDHHPVVPDLDLGRVSDLAAVRGASETFRGTVLQLSNVYTIGDEGATLGGRLTYGNMLAAAGYVSVNHYTGIGYAAFQRSLSFDHRGSLLNNDPMRQLNRNVPGYRTPLVDVLGVDTLVLTRGAYQPEDYRPRPGWRTVLRDEARIVVQRREVPTPGPRVTPSPGVDVVAAEDDGLGSRISVRSDEGGTVLLNRLNWPGYRASTDDGRAVEVSEGPHGLVELTVPPGGTVVHLEYEIPGLRTGLVAALVGILAALAHQLLWRRANRRAEGSVAQPVA